MDGGPKDGELGRKLDDIAGSLRAIEGRLARLEARSQPTTEPRPNFTGLSALPRVITGPPPIVAEPAPRISTPPAAAYSNAAPNEEPFRPSEFPSSIPRGRAPEEDAESRIGAKLFATLGALAVASGLVYATTELIQNGVITRPIQFVLSWLLSVFFVVSGLIVERKVANVGQILVGLGSLAAYLAVVGGRFTFGLYGDETTLGLTVLVAAANLGYGTFRAQEAFAWLGLVGGTLAAIVARQRFGVATGLEVAVALAAGAAAWRRDWRGVLWGAWGFGTLGLAVALFTAHPMDPAPRALAVVPLLALAAVATEVLRRKSIRAVSETPFVLVLPYGTASLLLALNDPPAPPLSSPLHEAPYLVLALLWSVLGVSASRRATEREEKWAFAFAAFLTFTAIPALVIPELWVVPFWTLDAAIAAALALRSNRPAILLGILWLGAATAVWDSSGWHQATNDSQRLFAAAIGAVISLLLLVAWFRTSTDRPADRLVDAGDQTLDFVGAAVACGGYVGCASYLVARFGGIESPTTWLGAGGFAALVIGALAHRSGARYAGWILVLGAAGSLLLHDLGDVPPAVRVGLLIVFGLAALGAAAFYTWRGKRPMPEPPPATPTP